MQIRNVRPEDLGEIRELNEASTPHVNSVPLDFFRRFLEAAPYFRLAETEEGIAGALLGLGPGLEYDSDNYRWFIARYENFMYIDRVFVATWARRRGVASALYEDFERFAREVGAPRLICEVNVRPRNEGSLTFHSRLGFREVGQQETEGGAKRVSLLVKDLPG